MEVDKDYVEGGKYYPYWKPDFDKVFSKNSRTLELSYMPKKTYDKYKAAEKNHSAVVDLADSYRVFMILCNNTVVESRMEVVELMKNSTFDNPIIIQDEVFWVEED
jgi:hypothetical protein